MANENINQHISSEERDRWNETSRKLNEHSESALHIPTPPTEGNYYLGNDLQWHAVPSVTID